MSFAKRQQGKGPNGVLHCPHVPRALLYTAKRHKENLETPTESLELWHLGLHISSVEDGTTGRRVWRVSSLADGHAAARSGRISVGDYLWEIENHCISANDTNALEIVRCLSGRTGKPGRWCLGVRKADTCPPTQSILIQLPLPTEIIATNSVTISATTPTTPSISPVANARHMPDSHFTLIHPSISTSSPWHFQILSFRPKFSQKPYTHSHFKMLEMPRE